MRALGTIAVLLFVTSCTVGNGRRVVPTSPGDEGDETDGAVATETDEGGGSGADRGIILPGLRGGPAYAAIGPLPPEVCELPKGYELLDVGKLVADPPAWAGEKLGLDGNVVIEYVFTAMACPPSAACCNKEGQIFYIENPAAPEERVRLTGLGCGFFECDCNPIPEGPSLVWGLVETDGEGASIAVEGSCQP